MNIRNILNLRTQQGKFGVEIELDGRHLPTHVSDNWRVERDGSVPNGLEYVFSKPVSFNKSISNIEELDEVLMNCNARIAHSFRAGVHVHLNVQEWSVNKLFTFITLYYLFEDILTHWCGPHREGNHFCLRLRDAEFVLQSIQQVVAERTLVHFQNDNIRYAALNFTSLSKYGSLEFRAMSSSPDLSNIVTWLTMINELEKAASKYENPLEILTQFSGEVPLEFFRSCFPKTHQLLEDYQELEDSMWKAVRRVQYYVFTTDWDTFKDAKKSKNIFDNDQLIGGF